MSNCWKFWPVGHPRYTSVIRVWNWRFVFWFLRRRRCSFCCRGWNGLLGLRNGPVGVGMVQVNWDSFCRIEVVYLEWEWSLGLGMVFRLGMVHFTGNWSFLSILLRLKLSISMVFEMVHLDSQYIVVTYTFALHFLGMVHHVFATSSSFSFLQFVTRLHSRHFSMQGASIDALAPRTQ